MSWQEVHSILNDQGAVLPRNGVEFFGPSTEINLGSVRVASPLVYAVADNTCVGSQFYVEASLICGNLQIAGKGARAGALPYWPSYVHATPEQRARYLEWLAGNRSDESVEQGYVFIYFYGLERRVLVDRADYLPVLEELCRLRKIYSRCHSFIGYSSILAWLTVALAGRTIDVPTPILNSLIETTPRLHQSILRPLLGYYYEREKRLPKAIAFSIAKSDDRTTKGSVFRQHELKFQELFEIKYVDRYGDGMKLQAARHPLGYSYQPASSTLRDPRLAKKIDSTIERIPDVLAISSQFADLANIWQECQEELQSFARSVRANGGAISGEAWENLPESLRNGEHPDTDSWLDLWTKSQNANAYPIVQIGDLATLRGFQRAEKLNKQQSEKLLATADAIGIGIEPDIRLVGGKYEWNDSVALFFRESETPSSVDAYQSAALMLDLGLTIAAADDAIAQEEVDHIRKHIDDRFCLSIDDGKRLYCRVELNRRALTSPPRITAAIKKKLSLADRSLVGTFLVGIAAVDQTITPAEKTALERLYKSIGLDADELNELLRPLTAINESDIGVAPQRGRGFTLDLSAVSKIQEDTALLRKRLCEVMTDPSESDFETKVGEVLPVEQLPQLDEQLPPPLVQLTVECEKLSPQPRFDGLHRRFHSFLEGIISKRDLSNGDLRELASESGVMLNAAIEAINEWVIDRHSEPLIEIEPEVIISTHLIPRLTP